jgi:hypothetical protein
MVVNMFKVTNNTDRPMKTNNLKNANDNISISAKSEGRHDAWLGGSNKPLEILWEDTGELIIKFWDEDWKIKYATQTDSGHVDVDGNKDFHIIVDAAYLHMTCFNGDFKNGKGDHRVEHTKY